MAARHAAKGEAMVGRYAEMVRGTTAEYARAMGELLTLLRAQEQEQEPVRHLMFRLDFNDFYRAGGKGFGGLLDEAAAAAASGGGGGERQAAAAGATAKSVRLMV